MRLQGIDLSQRNAIVNLDDGPPQRFTKAITRSTALATTRFVARSRAPNPEC